MRSSWHSSEGRDREPLGARVRPRPTLRGLPTLANLAHVLSRVGSSEHPAIVEVFYAPSDLFRQYYTAKCEVSMVSFLLRTSERLRSVQLTGC